MSIKIVWWGLKILNIVLNIEIIIFYKNGKYEMYEIYK